jgi:hypothetical protein
MKPIVAALIALTTSLTLTACDTEKYQPITVAVYPNLSQCMIKEHALPCAEVGTHLRDKLSIAPDRQIDVSMYRMDKSHNPKDIEQVAVIVRAAGFKDVRVWHFSFD